MVRHGRYRSGRSGVTYYLRCLRCAAEDVTRRHQKVRAILIDEAGGRCAVCGYHACHYNLHFHHVDPTQKSSP